MKKYISILLALFMVFQLFTFNVHTEDVNEPNPVQDEVLKKALEDNYVDVDQTKFTLPEGDKSSESYQSLLNQLGQEYLENLTEDEWNQKRSFILELNDDNPVVTYSRRSRRSLNNPSNQAIFRANQQKFLKDEIKRELGTQSTHSRRRRSLDNKTFVERSFVNLVNGMTMELSLRDAFRLSNRPEIKAIYLDSEIARPEIENLTPQMYSTVDMIKSNIANKSGYNGEGRVVAIIDSGADVSHPDFRLSDVSKAKYSQAKINEMIDKHLLKGRFFTDKVPYAYNYMDHDDNIIDETGSNGTGMHGMHVAGTVAANQEKPENGFLMKGVVPEAQLLVMRVFGANKPGTSASAYIEAVDDAIVLGADAINMSLGSTIGNEKYLPLTMTKVIEKAQDAGIIVAIAAGNDRYTQWGPKTLPKVNNPNYGVVGTPAIADGSLAVASLNNNKTIKEQAIAFTNAENQEEKMVLNAGSGFKFQDTIKENTPYQLVVVGLGKDEDYAGKDVKGKIALIQRGEISFIDKAKNAEKYGAVAAIVGNNQEGVLNMALQDGVIPTYSILKAEYEKLVKLVEKPDFTVKFTGFLSVDNPDKGLMSEFSSWGPTPGLKIKPEITAPGGDIYSTFNVNSGKYGTMSGTSMAAPHIAGAVTAVNQFLDTKGLSGKDRYTLAKNLLMVTADPVVWKDDNSLYNSVRNQGAGLVNLEKATNANYVTIVDQNEGSSKDKSKIELGEVNDKFSINLKLTNHSEKNVKYNVKAYVATDDVKDGRFTMTPKLIKNVELGEVEVPANNSADFTKEVSYDDVVAEFKTAAPNGFMVEGFIFFEPVVENAEGTKDFVRLSIPFLGFNGSYKNLPIFEKFIDEFGDFVADEKMERPTFYQEYVREVDNGDGTTTKLTYKEPASLPWQLRNFTHFYSETKHEFLILDRNMLGATIEGKATDNIAISPNNDFAQDYMSFRGVFLRDYDELTIRVEDNTGKTIYTANNPYVKAGSKSYIYSDRAQRPSLYFDLWGWQGKDLDGNVVPDGEYKFIVEAKPLDVDGADVQRLEKTVKVDTVMPKVEVLDIFETKGDKEEPYKAFEKDKDGKNQLVTKYEKPQIVNVKLKVSDDFSGVKNVTGRVYREPNYEAQILPIIILPEDAHVNVDSKDEQEVILQFKIPAGLRLDIQKELTYVKVFVTDWAGNRVDVPLTTKTRGSVEVEYQIDGKKVTPPEMQVMLQQKLKGPYGDYEQDMNRFNDLDFGKFKLKLLAAPTDYNVTIEPEEIELTEGNPTGKFTVKLEKVAEEELNNYSYVTAIFENIYDYPQAASVRMFASQVNKDDLELDDKGRPLLDFIDESTFIKTYELPKFRSHADGWYKGRLPEGSYVVYAWDVDANRKVAPMLNSPAYVELGKQTDQTVKMFYNTASLDYTWIVLRTKDVDLDEYFAPWTNFYMLAGNSLAIIRQNEHLFVSATNDMIGDNVGERVLYDAGNMKLDDGTRVKVLKLWTAKGNYDIKFHPMMKEGYDEKYKGGTIIPDTKHTFKLLNPGFKPAMKAEQFQALAEQYGILNVGFQIEVTKKYPGTGSLTINTEFLNKKYNEEKPHITYKVYNANEELVENLKEMEMGTYTVIGEGPEGFRTEKASYTVDITPEKPNAELNVRWFNSNDETKNPAMIEVGFQGVPSYSYDQPIKVTFTNKKTNKETVLTFNMPKDNLQYTLLDRGVYSVKLDLKDGYDFIIYSSRTKGGDRVQEYPDSLLMQEASEYIEFELIKRAPNIEKTQNKLKIKEFVNGTEEAVNGVTYKLVEKIEKGNPKYVFTTDKKEFINLQPGEYTLIVNDLPNGLMSVPREQVVKVAEGDANEAEVKFYSLANYTIKETIDGKPVEEYSEEELAKMPRLSVTYEAKTSVNGEEVVFKDTEFPEGVEITVAPKYITGGYVLVGDPQVVTLEKGKENVLVFNYTFSGNELLEAIKKAEEFLKENDYKLAFDYKDKLREVIQDDKDYLTNPAQSRAEIARRAKELLDLIANPVYPEPPYIPEDTIEDRPIEWENDQVVVKPQEPKENKEEPKQDDKKDYGILVPERNINITFKDIENVSNKEEILDLAQRGILKGDDLGNFNPDEKVTRAMLVETLYRISKDKTKDVNKNYVDVKTSDWYYESIMWASAKNIIQGNDNQEAMPNKELTREELAVIMARYLKDIPFEIKKAFTYEDENQISDWAKAAIKEMDEKGIIIGHDQTHYSPKEGVTRKELAHTLYVIIQRVLELTK